MRNKTAILLLLLVGTAPDAWPQKVESPPPRRKLVEHGNGFRISPADGTQKLAPLPYYLTPDGTLVSRSTAISRFGRPKPHPWLEEVEWAPPGRESIERGDGFLIYLAGVPADETQQLASAIYHVRRDGTLALPHVGQLVVAGLTVDQAATVVQQAYVDRKIYRHPTVMLRRAPNPDPWHLFPRLDVPGPGYRLKGNSLLINRLQG